MTETGRDSLDDLDAPGFIISSKTRLSHHPLPGILKGGMEQRKRHRLYDHDGDDGDDDDDDDDDMIQAYKL